MLWRRCTFSVKPFYCISMAKSSGFVIHAACFCTDAVSRATQRTVQAMAIIPLLSSSTYAKQVLSALFELGSTYKSATRKHFAVVSVCTISSIRCTTT